MRRKGKNAGAKARKLAMVGGRPSSQLYAHPVGAAREPVEPNPMNPRYRKIQPKSADPGRRAFGPRHMRPTLVRFAALFHILSRFFLVVSVLGIPVAILLHEDGSIPKYSLFLPLALFLITGLFWLMAASRVSCRVCSMKMFIGKTCTRSPKAPNLLGIGTRNTAALSALFTRSVRCPYCGTPNDLAGGGRRRR